MKCKDEECYERLKKEMKTNFMMLETNMKKEIADLKGENEKKR